jgi:tetratricopeptide (TPR) repeat protein
MAPDSTLLADLRAHIANRDVLVLVGAGVSAAATNGQAIAQWKGLLHHGLERCKAVCALTDDWLAKKQADLNSDDIDDLFSVAEIVASKLGAPAGGEYGRWLRESVGSLRAVDRAVLEALRDLKLPIATTNYDGLIEEVTGWLVVTWQDGAKVERVLRGDDQGVLHLHGFWDQPETVILGIRDYAKILGDIHAQTMQRTIRATRTLLFVGCGEGLRDPNFGAFLKWSEPVFAASEYRHFRLARESEVAELQKLHASAQRLFVLSYGSNHADLAPFLRSLAPRETPPVPVPASPRSLRLPHVAYCFGRDDLVSDLVATLLEDNPPPTAILGGPGHGKTTVSLKAVHDPRVAERYGTRRFFVRCDGAKTRDALAGEIALAMGLEPGPNLVDRAFAELERDRAALVLDNAETPWEADTLATEELLAQLADIRGLCLIVSVRGQQRPQGVAWREPVGVPPLDLPAARQAFLARAGERFSADSHLDDLVNAVDRVPLAITLLAYQAEGQPNLDGLWARWQAERTLMLQRAGGTHRLNNLELSLELSVSGSRMNDAAGSLLSLLGLLPDGIAWADLDALLSGNGHAPAADLRRVGLAFDDAKSARLRVLAPVREYVHRRLIPVEADMARARDHYLSLAEILGNKVGQEGGAESAARLAPELSNLEAMILIALDQPDLEPAVRGACGLARLTLFTGLGSLHALEQAADAARSRSDAAAEAGCLLSLGHIAQVRSDHDEARQRYEAGLSLYRRVGSVAGEASCIKSLGNIALDRSNYDEARQRLEAALALYRRAGSVLGEANCIRSLGDVALRRSDHDEARQHYEDALPLFRRVGNVVGEANCIEGLGHIALRCSDLDEARHRYEAALSLFRRVGAVHGEANCIKGLGDIARDASEHDKARSLYEQALRLYSRIPEPYSIGLTHGRLARLAADDVVRREHVEAARAAWSSLNRTDLIENLDKEFGSPEQAEAGA